MRTFCVLFFSDYLVYSAHLRNVKFENGMKQLYNCLNCNIMKLKFFPATLLAALLLCLAACGNEHDEDSLPGALPYTKSYFVGLMNDSLINIRQDSYYDVRIDPLLYIPQDSYQHIDITGWLIRFAADYRDEPWATMHLQWGPMETGTFELTSSKLVDANAERVPYISLTFADSGRTYCCSPEHPFLLQVDDVDYKDAAMTSFPVVTGRMEGTLYNEADPADCITFEDVEFRLWR